MTSSCLRVAAAAVADGAASGARAGEGGVVLPRPAGERAGAVRDGRDAELEAGRLLQARPPHPQGRARRGGHPCDALAPDPARDSRGLCDLGGQFKPLVALFPNMDVAFEPVRPQNPAPASGFYSSTQTVGATPTQVFGGQGLGRPVSRAETLAAASGLTGCGA
jgi:hypothetical protein